jgi:hypothetical protein
MLSTQSQFSRTRQHDLQETSRRLVSGLLEEHASPENIVAAVDWCLGRFREDTRDTHAGEVDKTFQQLLEKLRVHSNTEAADYLTQQRAAFFKCHLSQRHVGEVHSAVLQSLMLLAYRPTHVPVGTVRQLRSIYEKRKAKVEQQRRNAHEQAHDRRAILAMELKQVAEGTSRDWEDAWSFAPLEPDDTGPIDVAVQGSQTVDGSLQGEAEVVASTIAEEAPSQASRLPRGVLPRPAWQERLGVMTDRGMPVVPEQVVVEMVVQLLMGHPGELVDSAAWQNGDVRWVPCAVRHLSSGMLMSILRPFADFSGVLMRLRKLTFVLQSLSPPLTNLHLCQKLSRCFADGRFNLAEICQAWDSVPHFSDADVSGLQQSIASRCILGLCWQGAGEVLKDLLEEFSKDLRSLDASFYSAKEGHDAWGATLDNASDSAVTLLRLERWADPYVKTITTVHDVLDSVLMGLPKRSMEHSSLEWAEVAAGELLCQLAAAIRGHSLCGNGNVGERATHWFGSLWTGAMRPVLQTMDQWAATGELYDPCGEFPGLQELCSRRGESPALLPQVVVSGGCQVHSLRAWAADVLMDCAMQRRTAKAGTSVASQVTSLPFTPLEVLIDSIALWPAAQLAQEATRPFLVRLLLDETRGLVHHIGALHLVAFLEREDVTLPLITRLFDHIQRRSPLGASCDALALELNYALAEGLEGRVEKDAKLTAPLAANAVRQLCSQHLTLVVVPEDAAVRANSKSPPCITPGSLKLRYQAPAPFDYVIDGPSLAAYSSVFGLLVRLRHAQSILLLLHGLPLFGIFCRFRRRWQRVGGHARSTAPVSGSRLLPLAHTCDLLRAEMTHFLGCFERYLRIDAIQETTNAFKASLLQLAQRLATDDSTTSTDFDILEQTRNLHVEYLRRLAQDCLLVPLRSVLEDTEHLIGLAAELHAILESLVQRLRRNDSSDIELSTEIGAESILGSVDEAEETLDLDSPDAIRAIAGASVEVLRIQKEFQRVAAFLLQVLMFSVARGGTAPRVSDFCFQMNFNGQYHKDL